MNKARVMVVEDERIVALNLKQRLINLGYDVPAMATSGVQALEQITRDPPDVVLMDVNIEGEIDGIETAARIPWDRYVPVIYLTAYSEETTLQRARVTKPYGFLLKPVSERDLHSAIQVALARRDQDITVQASEQRLTVLVEQRTTELHKQIAASQKTEAALRQAQKMEAVGQLTGGIAHDFNNLVQGILGSLTLLQKNLHRGRIAEADRLITNATISANRAAALTHRLLAFARRQPLNPTAVDANHLIGTMMDLVRRTVGEAITVTLVPAPELWLTRCDSNQLESAILNLVINARDAMPNGGQITIETKNAALDTALSAQMDLPPGQYVCVDVSDTGTGMSAEVAAQAFEPFFTTKPLGQGTGLGLSMIYGFARQSEGFVKICSEPGRGTAVKLYLPRSDCIMAAAPAAVTATETTRVPQDGEVILVVEDDAVVRELVTEVLQELGYDVIQASDGTAALTILRSAQRVDLLVTDMGLPGTGGRQVATVGRALRPELKVLFMTGYAGSAAKANGFWPLGWT